MPIELVYLAALLITICIFRFMKGCWLVSLSCWP